MVAVVLAAFDLTSAPAGAQVAAQEVTITEYALPTPDSLPGGIVVGPDNALWFYETGANQIGRISLDGNITGPGRRRGARNSGPGTTALAGAPKLVHQT